ncbi:MAG: menaquinone biosynthesis protein [Holophagaceae bacterium]|nr:menaquinone biosynthesis protein [Holophagaceae bacterium]
MSDLTPFRISIIDFLNAAPLNYGFKHDLGFKHFHLKFQVPSACSDSLLLGEVDAGLISSIEYLRIPGVKIVPGLCIASPKRVRSVLLLSKVQPESIQELALDASSRTSAVLAQMILRERYGAAPKVTEMLPDIKTMLAEHDAALIIGDAAMRVNRLGLMVLDLAEEWHTWTGLPFVFALWAVRPDAPKLDMPGGVAPFFRQSFELGKKNIENIVDEAWRTIGWTKQELRDYLTINLRHTLGDAERKSLALFFEKSVKMGFAQENLPLRFLKTDT